MDAEADASSAPATEPAIPLPPHLTEEKATTRKTKRFHLLPGERILKLVSDENTKAETEWKVDDKVEVGPPCFLSFGLSLFSIV